MCIRDRRYIDPNALKGKDINEILCDQLSSTFESSWNALQRDVFRHDAPRLAKELKDLWSKAVRVCHYEKFGELRH